MQVLFTCDVVGTPECVVDCDFVRLLDRQNQPLDYLGFPDHRRIETSNHDICIGSTEYLHEICAVNTQSSPRSAVSSVALWRSPVRDARGGVRTPRETPQRRRVRPIMSPLKSYVIYLRSISHIFRQLTVPHREVPYLELSCFLVRRPD